jgi:hypothetical protein
MFITLKASTFKHHCAVFIATQYYSERVELLPIGWQWLRFYCTVRLDINALSLDCYMLPCMRLALN